MNENLHAEKEEDNKIKKKIVWLQKKVSKLDKLINRLMKINNERGKK